MDWGNWEIIGLGLTSTQAGTGVVIALPDYSFHACGLRVGFADRFCPVLGFYIGLI